MKRLLEVSIIPAEVDLGLLFIRIALGGSLFIIHGWEKMANHSELARRFADPIGVGSQFSFTFAMISDALCSVLIALGLLTRPATLVVAVNVAVAFVFVQHGRGENTWAYFWWTVLLFCGGPGRYSLDTLLFRGEQNKQRPFPR